MVTCLRLIKQRLIYEAKGGTGSMTNRFAIVLASGSGIAAGLASKNRVSAGNNFIKGA
jgi:hypothetical protein